MKSILEDSGEYRHSKNCGLNLVPFSLISFWLFFCFSVAVCYIDESQALWLKLRASLFRTKVMNINKP